MISIEYLTMIYPPRHQSVTQCRYADDLIFFWVDQLINWTIDEVVYYNIKGQGFLVKNGM